MIYELTWIEKKTTSTGKELMEVQIKDVEGKDCGSATIWKVDKDNKVFPNYDNLMPGAKIEATRWENPTTGKASLYAPKPQGEARVGSQGRSTANITKMMDKKEGSIAKFQDNKDWSIRVSSTMRDSVLCAIEEHRGDMNKDLKELVLKWRAFLWENWEKDITDTPPFP